MVVNLPTFVSCVHIDHHVQRSICLLRNHKRSGIGHWNAQYALRIPHSPSGVVSTVVLLIIVDVPKSRIECSVQYVQPEIGSERGMASTVHAATTRNYRIPDRYVIQAYDVRGHHRTGDTRTFVGVRNFRSGPYRR